MNERKNKIFGLLGKDIEYSFSRGYFAKKFDDLNLESHQYVNFDIPMIEDFPSIIKNTKNLSGINVTIPYKQEVMQFLDEIDETAKKIGAVNTIKITKKGTLKGYNTDIFGFENSIKPFFKEQHQKALILGTGGASKAVAFAFKNNKISYKFVSRNPIGNEQVSYENLTEKILQDYHVIVNCSPIGTSPNIEQSPNIPYEFLSKKHLLFDLIYNPKITTFLSKGQKKGTVIKNGYQMLELQAEESWRIWNNHSN